MVHPQPKSVWEGHPAKVISKGVERTAEGNFFEVDLESYNKPCTFNLTVFLLEVRPTGIGFVESQEGRQRRRCRDTTNMTKDGRFRDKVQSRWRGSAEASLSCSRRPSPPSPIVSLRSERASVLKSNSVDTTVGGRREEVACLPGLFVSTWYCTLFYELRLPVRAWQIL